MFDGMSELIMIQLRQPTTNVKNILEKSKFGKVVKHWTQGCPRPKFTTLPVQVQVPAVVVVPVQVDETKPAVLSYQYK